METSQEPLKEKPISSSIVHEDRSIHIAYITPEYPAPGIKHSAGIGTSIYNLALAFVKKGIQVTVIAYGQEKEDVFTDQGIRVITIRKRQYSALGWYFHRKHIQKKVAKFIDEYNIGILEAPDWTGITAFMRFKVPLVLRLHGSDTYFCHIEGRPQKRKNRLFEAKAIRQADAISSPTQFTLDKTLELFPSIQKKRSAVIPNGLFLDNFNIEEEMSQKHQILNFGTVVRKKGALALAKIFNELHKQDSEVRLLVAGSDSPDALSGNSSTWQMMNTLLSDSAKKNVTYLGKVPYAEIKGLIAASSVCVFPTMAETFGMVTVEAMAMGRPVVNSNYGWAQEMIEDGKNGILVDPNDVAACAAAILAILKNPEKATSLGMHARARVEEHYDISAIADIYVDFFKSLLP